MIETLVNRIASRCLDINHMVNSDEAAVLSKYINETGKRIPKLADGVMDAFGKVLDIFAEPANLRIPDYDSTNFVPDDEISFKNCPLEPNSRNKDEADYVRALENNYISLKTGPARIGNAKLLHRDVYITMKGMNEMNDFSEPGRVNVDLIDGNECKSSSFQTEYLGKRTKALYDRYDTLDCASPPIEMDKDRLKYSASPCMEDLRLCGDCYVALASIRCNTCMLCLCAVCSSRRHSSELYKSHILTTANTNRNVQLSSVDTDDKRLDLSINLNTEVAMPAYDKCEIHSRSELRYSCVSCHFIPLCTICMNESHLHHKVVDIEMAVSEVKEVLNDCLNTLVDKYNVLSTILPEMDHVYHFSDVSVKNAVRSVKCSIQRSLDALRLKQLTCEGEIKNLQQLGSSILNRFISTSDNYRHYLENKTRQLQRLSKFKEPGLALNTFVDLRPNFEQLLYHCDDLPDLALEVPHWQLYSGNLPNLLTDSEHRINNRVSQINYLCGVIKTESAQASKLIEDVVMGVPAESDLSFASVDKVKSIDNIKEDTTAVESTNLRPIQNTFLRKDSVHRIWCKRTVTLTNYYLLVSNDSKVESKIDLRAVTVKSFDDDDVLETTQITRLNSPHGFEIVEKKGNDLRFWIFTCEYRNIALLWTAKLQKIAKNGYKANISSRPAGRSPLYLAPAEDVSQRSAIDAAGNPNTVPRDVKQVKRGEDEETKSASFNEQVSSLAKNDVNPPHLNPSYVQYTNINHPSALCPEIVDERGKLIPLHSGRLDLPLNFKEVSESLKRIKADSAALYEKCFNKTGECRIVKNVETRITENVSHNVEYPSDDSDEDVPLSAGRYSIPNAGMSKKSNKNSNTLECTLRVPEHLPEFKYLPCITSPKSIHSFFQNKSE